MCECNDISKGINPLDRTSPKTRAMNITNFLAGARRLVSRDETLTKFMSSKVYLKLIKNFDARNAYLIDIQKYSAINKNTKVYILRHSNKVLPNNDIGIIIIVNSLYKTNACAVVQLTKSSAGPALNGIIIGPNGRIEGITLLANNGLGKPDYFPGGNSGSFGACCKCAWDDLGSDFIGIAAEATNPIGCMAACMAACAFLMPPDWVNPYTT